MYRIHFYVVLLVFCLCIAGCKDRGPGLKAATGTVTLDGKPLIGAEVEFHPESAASSSYGKTDESGNFSLAYSTGKAGAALGKHRVVIIGGSTDAASATSAPVANTATDREEVAIAFDQMPKTHSNNLSAEVTASGPNHFEFNL